MKGLKQFSLLDTHQLARFLLDVPDLDVRENLERRAVAVLQAPRPSGYAAYPSRGAPQKAHQAIRLAQGKCLQDDGFRFPRRHEQSARARRAIVITTRALIAQCSGGKYLSKSSEVPRRT